MAVGAGFQDVEMQMRYGEAASQRARLRQLDQYRRQMDQQRMQREDQIYARKQQVDQHERAKERMGAELSGAMMQGGTKEELYARVQDIIQKEKYRDIDPAGTDAGRGMFGAYGMFGRRSGDVSDVTLEKDLKSLRDAKTKGDETSERLVQARLDKNPRYLEIQKNIEGGVWLSDMKGGESGEGGDFETLVKGKPEQRIKGRMGTFDDRYGGKAYALALTEAIVQGGKRGLSAEQVTAGFNEWWDKKHGQNTGRWQTYADREGFAESDVVSAAAMESTGQGRKVLGEADKQAIKWAKDNPNDPRAKQILAMHGVK